MTTQEEDEMWWAEDGPPSWNALLILARRGDPRAREAVPDWPRQIRAWWECSRRRGSGAAPEEYETIPDALLRERAYRAIPCAQELRP